MAHKMLRFDANARRSMERGVNKLANAVKVTLHTSSYPLDAVNDAMADLENGNLHGRGILVPEGASA